MVAIHIARQRPNVRWVRPYMPDPPLPGSGSYREVQDTFTWLRMQPEYEFWASYLGTFNRYITRDVETAAVTIENGDLMMMINPDYVCMDDFNTMALRAGPTVHEMHHPLLGHLSSSGPPPGELGNICSDLSVNSVMDESMRAKFHLHPRQFFVDGRPLDAGRGWRYYWDQLIEVFELGEIDGLKPGDMDDLIDGKRILTGKGLWGDEPGDLMFTLTKQKLERASSMMDKSKIPKIVEIMLNTKYAPLDVIWHVAFKSACRGYTRSRKTRTMAKRGRRTQMPPGPKKGSVPTIMWAVDTSGSMSESEIEKGYAVLNEIRQRDGIRVLTQQFDSKLQGDLVELDKFKRIPTDIHGRGGTNFGPVFELANKIRPSVLCVFTDGYASPAKRPPFPVVWVYTPHHQRQDFGKHIVVNDRPDTADKEW